MRHSSPIDAQWLIKQLLQIADADPNPLSVLSSNIDKISLVDYAIAVESNFNAGRFYNQHELAWQKFVSAQR